MNLEETKKMIENKIEAEALTRNVISQIKSYVDQKQNLREGFKETFQPLIASQDAVKTSIDSQHNKLINQLQENELALTEGLNKNRLAITQGFDKMEEVRRSDLDLLPSFEAIEHPEIKTEEIKEPEGIEEEPIYSISDNDIYRIKGQEFRIKKSGEKLYRIKESYLDYLLSQNTLDDKKYEIEIDPNTRIVKVIKKPITTVTYGKDEMDKHLNYTETIELLNFYGLKLPSEYKDKSMEEFQKAFDKGMDETANLKKSIKNVAYYKKDSNTGLILAFEKAGENAAQKTKDLIREYNIMQIFINNMGQLRNCKKLTGTGIIHFNNPLQLLDRLELLVGSLNAGNNGVKQEFTQIVHLLHQLKVITKKQLNDLLKKYILNK